MDSDILVVSEHTNPDKIERHVGPLAAVSERTTMVCLTPNPNVDIDYVRVPSFGHRLIGIVLISLVALREAIRNDFDLIVSFSLFPYGIYALMVGTLTGTPTHLGILGADLDVHAHAWYRRLPEAAFRRFDSISVLGTAHRAQLIEHGIAESDVFVLTDAIDTEQYSPTAKEDEATYDFVWSGRFAPEKDPLLFVESIRELRTRGYDIRAVMLGSGELEDDIGERIRNYDLTAEITVTGWVDEPAEYYAQANTFVLTSDREALGLALIESMAMGLGCVAPPVGNIPDIADDGENALLVDNHDPKSFADAMERVLTNDDLRDRIGANAIQVGQSYSYDNAREDWRAIIEYTAD